MTAWQDEPPLTRRQMRMREREGGAAPAHRRPASTASGAESVGTWFGIHLTRHR